MLALISDHPTDPDEMNAVVRAAAAFGVQLEYHEAKIKLSRRSRWAKKV